MTDVIRLDRQVNLFLESLEPTFMGTVNLSSPFDGDSVVLGKKRYTVVRIDRDEQEKTDDVYLVTE